MDSTSERETEDLQGLRRRLSDKRAYVRESALATFIQRPVPELLDSVVVCQHAQDANVCYLAAVALARLGLPAKAALTASLAPIHDVTVRIVAASGLSDLGEQAQLAIVPLRECLGDPDETLRWHAAFALGSIGKPAVATLIELLGASNREVQTLAAKTLGRIGPAADASASRLAELTCSAEPPLQTVAHASLVKVTGDLANGLPALLDATSHEDAEFRKTAIEQIGELGEQGRDALGRIVDCLADDRSEVVCAAALAIARIKGSEDLRGIDELAATLAENDVESRRHALIALASFGASAYSALPRMRPLVSDADPRIAATAKAAIALIDT